MALTRITKGVIKPNENYDTHNINSTGIVTAIGLDVNGNGDISGNLSVGGVLTYEDVTSIDSVGIITARNGIDCNGDIDVDGHTNLDNISVAGVTTFSNNVHVGTGITFETNGQGTFSGIVTSRGFNVAYTNDNGVSNSFIAGRIKIFDPGSQCQIQFGTGPSYSPHQKYASVMTYRTNAFTLQNTGTTRTALSWVNSDGPVNLWYTGGYAPDYSIKLSTHSGGINVSGVTTTRDLAVTGVSTFTGAIDANGDLDVDGHTNLDNVSVAGVSTFSGNITGAAGVNLNLDSTLGNSSSTAFSGFDGRLVFDTTFSDTARGPNKIQLQNTGGWVGGFGISSNTLDIYTGGITAFRRSNGVNTYTTQMSLDANGNLSPSGDVRLTSSAGSNSSTSVVNSVWSRLEFDTDYSDTARGPNKIVLQHDGSWYGGFGISSNTLDVYTGGIIHFHGKTNNDDASNIETMAKFTTDGAAELYHNNIKTFTTTNEGATFDTGSSSCVVRLTSNTDAVTVLQGFNSDFYLKGPSGGNLILYANGNEDAVKCIPNGAVELYHNGNRQVFTIDGGMNWQDSKKAEFGNSGDLKIYHESNVNYIYGSTNTPIAFMANADEKLRINTNGRIGIGTDNPQQLLDLYDIQAGASGTAPVLLIRNGYAGTPNTSNALKSELRFAHRNHNSAHDFMATRIISDTSDNYNQRTHLRFYVAKGNNGTERLTISPDGYIGINDSTPQYALDIKPDGGNVNQTPIIRISNDSDGCHNAITLESSTSADKNIGIQFKNRNAVRGGIGYIQSDKMSFYSGTTPGGNGITINASGFVGVGKADPDRTFHVYRNSETWPAGFETNNTTCKISFKSAGTTNMYEVGVGAESRSLIFLTANSIRNDITTDGVMRTRTLGGGFYPVASVRDGSTSARAAQSAWEIKKTLGPAAHTGYYYLKNPYDNTVSQWWCDMDTDGGGWILVASVGDGQMSALSTADGNHWYNRSNKGGFDGTTSGYYKGGGYWRKTNGGWGDNTCGQLMWDVRIHGSDLFGNDHSNHKVAFNWGRDQALPSGGSSQSNIPNAGNRKFMNWCYNVLNAPQFDPGNYHQNSRSNTINGSNHFTEHMVITWSFRGTGGADDDGEQGPYFQIGAHHDGLHQHHEESIQGGDGMYGDGGYLYAGNEKGGGWGGGGSNSGVDRKASHNQSLGTCKVWLR